MIIINWADAKIVGSETWMKQMIKKERNRAVCENCEVPTNIDKLFKKLYNNHIFYVCNKCYRQTILENE